MPASDEKLWLDRQLVDVHLTGLQSEVEAKLRRMTKFRAEMGKMDAASGRSDPAVYRRVARALIEQTETMLETNLAVRTMLEDLRKAAEAILSDVEEHARGRSGPTER